MRDIKGKNVVAIILLRKKKILYQIQNFKIDKKYCLLLFIIIIRGPSLFSSEPGFKRISIGNCLLKIIVK